MEENNQLNMNDVEQISEKSEENILIEESNQETASFEEINTNEIIDDNLPLEIAQEEDAVVINSPEPSDVAENKKGFKFFILFIATALIITAFTTFGYFAGKNQSVGNKNHSLDLTPKPTDTAQYTADAVYEIVNKSVVGIAVYDSKEIKGYASGVIYSEDGYIITNDHIYADVPGAKFKIYTFDGKVYSAKYIAGDTRSDLAVLKVDESGFYPATFGNSDELKYGEEVVAIGRPNDATASSSITGGYISFLNRRVSNTTSYASRLIQTDSAINPGSSGGALVNMYGQVVGITSSKLVGSEYEGVGYAIPTTTVKLIVEELIEHGSVVSRAKLGISYTEINEVTAEINGTDITGLLVAEVTEASPLYGKISKGDIITEINGKKISKGDMVLDIIEESKPGDTVELTVYFSKNGSTKTYSAALVQAESESSYKSELASNNETGGGTFDFPYGY